MKKKRKRKREVKWMRMKQNRSTGQSNDQSWAKTLSVKDNGTETHDPNLEMKVVIGGQEGTAIQTS